MIGARLSSVHGDIYELFARKGEFLDLASNINPFKPKDLDSKLLEFVERAFYYPENRYESLRSAIASSMNWDLNEIVFGNGSIELIEFFFRVVRGKIVIAQPTFTEYERFAKIYGSRVIDVKYNINEILDAIGRIKPDGLVICNPNNPTGDFIRKEDFEEIVEAAERFGTKVLTDQAFIDFVKPYDVDAFQVRSLTKILGIPGLRFGYGRFPKEFAKKFEEMRIPWNVNNLAKAVAENYLPKLRAFSRFVRRKMAREKEHLRRRLKKLGIEAQGKANFLLCYGIDSEKLFEFMLSRRILIRRCEDFKYLDDKYFRIAVKDRKSNRIFLKNLEEFRDTFR